MKKYVLYSHDGSANHGCEALVRTTVELLDYKNNDIVVISTNPEEDYKYGIDDFCTIIKRGSKVSPKRRSLKFCRAYLAQKLFHNYLPMDYLSEASSVGVSKKDIAIAIGGDSYCYGEAIVNYLAYEHMVWKSEGLKTVYWGCSIEPELLDNPEIAKDIKKFDLITARESISYNALKKVNPNTVLVADSAFLLNKKEVSMPNNFEDCDLVGINLSPLVEEYEKTKGITRENYCRLIEKILNETDMKILLIPHVVWEKNDDRVILNELYQKYQSTGRILLVEDHNCEEIKGYISRCRFFVGARTHATIAAYSTGVPTLVLGYSVKSRGIAEDLFGSWENYVLPVQNLRNSDDLVKNFEWIMSNETEIKDRLNNMVPQFKKRVYVGIEALKKL